MTLKKLLLATAAVAMTATTANALNLDVTVPNAPVTPAAELQFPAVAGTADLVFEVTTTTGGDFPAGNNIAVGVTLPAGISFSETVVGTDVSSTDGTVSAVVQGGSGQVNSTVVDLLISIPQGSAIDDLDFSFDVKLDSCPTTPSPLTVTVRTETGTDIEEGTVQPGAGDNVVNACKDAVSVVVLDDEATTPAGVDSFIQLPNYNTLNNGVVGQVNGIIDGTVARNLSGDPVEDDDIEEVTLTFNVPDVSGLDDLTFLGTPYDLTTATRTSGPAAINVSITGADLATFFGGTNDVTITTLGTIPVVTQQLSVSNIVVDFLDAVTGGTPASETGARENFRPTEAQAGGNIDFLQREGQAFGYFDWVGGDANRTVTVLRATGMPTMSPTPFTITFDNAVPPSLNGQTFTGTYNPANATGDLVGSGEFTMNTALGMGLDTPPTFLRADILVNFETNADIDVDRLMARNGIITNYGDGANNSYNVVFSNTIPNFDSDNTNGTE